MTQSLLDLKNRAAGANEIRINNAIGTVSESNLSDKNSCEAIAGTSYCEMRNTSYEHANERINDNLGVIRDRNPPNENIKFPFNPFHPVGTAVSKTGRTVESVPSRVVGPVGSALASSNRGSRSVGEQCRSRGSQDHVELQASATRRVINQPSFDSEVPNVPIINSELLSPMGNGLSNDIINCDLEIVGNVMSDNMIGSVVSNRSIENETSDYCERDNRELSTMMGNVVHRNTNSDIGNASSTSETGNVMSNNSGLNNSEIIKSMGNVMSKEISQNTVFSGNVGRVRSNPVSGNLLFESAAGTAVSNNVGNVPSRDDTGTAVSESEGASVPLRDAVGHVGSSTEVNSAASQGELRVDPEVERIVTELMNTGTCARLEGVNQFENGENEVFNPINHIQGSVEYIDPINGLTNVRNSNLNEYTSNLTPSIPATSAEVTVPLPQRLTRQQAKAIKSAKHVLPWTNSDFVNCVTVCIRSMEIEFPDVNDVIGEDVNASCSDPNIQHHSVFSVHTLPYILAMVKDRPEQVFLDTGSTLNLAAAEAFPNEAVTPVSNVQLSSASGHIIPLEGKIVLDVNFANMVLPCEFVLVKGLEMRLLLGNAIFRAYHFNLNYNDMQCSFFHDGKSSGPIPVLLQPGNPLVNMIKYTRTPVLSIESGAKDGWVDLNIAHTYFVQSEYDVPLIHVWKLQANGSIYVGPKCTHGVHLNDMEARLSKLPITIYRAALKRKNLSYELEKLPEGYNLTLYNYSDEPQVLHEGFTLAYGYSLDRQINSAQDLTDKEFLEYNRLQRKYEFDISEFHFGAGTPEKWIQKAKAIISSFDDIWTNKTTLIGRLKNYKATIAVKPDAEIVYCKPYKQSMQQQNIMKTVLTELFDARIIRESNSPYCSPCMLVPRKTPEDHTGMPQDPSKEKDKYLDPKNWRFVTDFSQINKIFLTPRQPVPLIQDVLEEIGQHDIFMSLDLNQAYYNLELDEDSRQYASFCTPFGQYEYCVLGFGLSVSPALFSRAFQKVLTEPPKLTPEEGITCYCDDVHLSSDNYETLLERLKFFLQKIKNNNLTIKPSKSEFFLKKIRILGFELEGKQIRPDPTKITCIKNFPVPRNRKAVQSYLGLCGFFRRFTFKFAEHAAPLIELTKPSVKFNWKAEHELAFRYLRDSLSEAALLSIYDPDKPTYLFCDTSAVAVGAILTQMSADNYLTPIAFYSKHLQEAQRKYGSTQLELYGAVNSIERWRTYLILRKFTVCTDHHALIYIKTKAKKPSIIQRYLLRLGDFCFDLLYNPALVHIASDCLSRYLPFEVTPEMLVSVETFEQPWLEPANEIDPMEELPLFMVEPHFNLKNQPSCSYPMSDFEDDEKGGGVSSSSLPWSSFDNSYIEEEVPEKVHKRRSERKYSPLSDESETDTEGARCLVIKHAYINFVTEDVLKEAQLKDKFCIDLITQLGNDDDSSRGFIMQKEILCKKQNLRLCKSAIPCIPESLLPQLLEQAHNDPTAGHQGYKKVYNSLKERFYFPKMYKYIENWVKRCETCQFRKCRVKRREGMLTNIYFEIPFQAISFDCFGPHAGSAGFKSAIVILDFTTKFAICEPLTNQKAKTIAKVLLEKVFLVYGIPKIIISDRSPTYTGQLLTQLNKLLGIEQRLTVAFRPLADGQSEAYVKTITRMLLNYSNDKQSNWSKYIRCLTYQYNCSIHSTTGMDPFTHLFNRKPVMISELGLDDIVPPTHPFAYKLYEGLKEIEKYTREHVKKMQASIKKQHDQTQIRPATVYQVGDHVLLAHKANVAKGLSPKLTIGTRGVYEIVEKIGERDLYRLKLVNKKRGIAQATLTANADQITKFLPPVDLAPAE